jgi:hypothetical protein
MNEIKDPLRVEEWPKGLYMIFVLDDDCLMGKVFGLTNTKALIHPWSFMFGGVDEEEAVEIVLADVKKFYAFDDIWEMDEYFNKHYWKHGEQHDPE